MRRTLLINLITASSVLAYAIFYSSLSLYLTEKSGLSIEESNSLVGLFIAFNFLLHLFAGYIGGKFIPQKSLLGIALISQFLGIFIITYTTIEFKIGISFFLIGCGFGTTCINCLLSQQFRNNEQEEREKAFFYNYSALNLGFFLGFLISGYFYVISSYQMLFKVGFLCNLLSLLIYLFCQKNLKQDTLPSSKYSFQQLRALGLTCVVIIYFGLFFGFHFENVTNISVLSLGIGSLVYVGIRARVSLEAYEKNNVYCFFVFVFSAIVFWTLYFIGPMGFMFFLKNNVQHQILGFQISPQWFMNLDSIFVILGAPSMAYFFQTLKKKSISISISKKFAFALFMIACSYLVLIQGVKSAGESSLVGVGWITVYYLFQAMGELLIAPVGYAMIGNLAPPSLQGMMMGIWLMTCGISSILSHHVSNFMAVTPLNSPIATNINYLLVFRNLGVYAFVAGTVLLLFSRKIDSFTEDKQANNNKLNVRLELIND